MRRKQSRKQRNVGFHILILGLGALTVGYGLGRSEVCEGQWRAAETRGRAGVRRPGPRADGLAGAPTLPARCPRCACGRAGECGTDAR